VKQPESGRERPVGDTVHDGTPQVTALTDAKAQDNRHQDVMRLLLCDQEFGVLALGVHGVL